jgi:hypothetical protein
MYLTITIDAEEDNWGEYTRASYSVENLRRVPQLQRIFDARGVRPTYLITYPVATSPVSVEILSGIARQGLCEIGSHPHAWNTPPIEEDRTPYNSYMHHLPSELQYRKLKTLHEAIAGNFGISPVTYRSGRWGFSQDVAQHLVALGYVVDTSILPGLDWRQYDGPDYSAWSSEPFTFRATVDGRTASLLEVPATVDFVQNPAIARPAYRAIRTLLPWGHRILGAMARLHVLNLVCLSPELETLPRMIGLAKALQRRRVEVVNMFFHSPTLLEGCSPFVRTRADVAAFLERIDGFLAFAQSAGMRPVTMSELARKGLGANTVKTELSPHVHLDPSKTKP